MLRLVRCEGPVEARRSGPVRPSSSCSRSTAARRGPLRAQLEEQLRAAVRDGRARARDRAAVDARARAPSSTCRAASSSRRTTSWRPRAIWLRARARRRAWPRPPSGRRRTRASPRRSARRASTSARVRPTWRCSRARAGCASLRRALRDAPDARLDYGDPRGAPELRAALAGYLGRVRGVACDPDRVIVTSGMAQGMALLGRTLLRARRATDRRRGAVDHARRGFSSSAPGWSRCRSTVDAHGLRVDRARRRGAGRRRRDARAPVPDRRGAGARAARRAGSTGRAPRGAFVLEDDYDAEYRYDRAPVGALQGLAPDRVVYAGTVSKTLAPALRLGWLVVPERLAGAIAAAKAADDLGTPVRGAARARRLPRARRARPPSAPDARGRTARGGTRSWPRSPATSRAASRAASPPGLHLVAPAAGGNGRTRRARARACARRRALRPRRSTR